MMLDPKTVACNLLDYIHRELTNFIDSMIGLYTPHVEEELLHPLNHPFYSPDSWALRGPYREFAFEVGGAKHSFETYLDTFEGLDASFAHELYNELTTQLKETVQGRIEYWQDKQAEEDQAAYMHEHVEALEEAIV